MEAPPPRVAAFFSLKILLSRHRFIEKLLAGLQGAQSGGLTGLLNGLVLPRSQAVLFSGNAMQPTINALPQHAQDKPDAHKEVLIVRSLNHIFAEHKKFHFLFPDFATRALEEELEKNPESERLLSIKESKFMHIFRPVNPGDIVLMKSPMGAAGASGRGLAAESAAGSDASTAPAADGDAAAASSAQDAYLVRRVAAVQGQELVASSGETHTLEAGTVWVTSDNEALSPRDAPDSRVFGPLPLSYILGRVIYRFSPHESGSVVENSIFGRYFDESVVQSEVPNYTQNAMALLSATGEEAMTAEADSRLIQCK